MSTGLLLFLAALVPIALLVGMQVLMRASARAMTGKPAPDGLPRDGLLFFHSPTCGPCRAMEPDVAALATDDARVRSVDVSRDMAWAQALRSSRARVSSGGRSFPGTAGGSASGSSPRTPMATGSSPGQSRARHWQPADVAARSVRTAPAA